MSNQAENWTEKIRGAHDHREFVGPTNEYDLNAAMQFNILTFLGLREFHTLLDIGCGSLRGGRLFIVYLLPNHYFGMEPEKWLVEKGIREEAGKDIIELKSPSFSHNSDFSCNIFDKKFDYILAQGVFVHAPEKQIKKCMVEASKCMKLTTIFAATYMEGKEDYAGGEWLYPEMSHYTQDRIKEMASTAGLSCARIEWPHPRGAKWIILYKPENKNNILKLLEEARKYNFFKRLEELQTKLEEVEKNLERFRANPVIKAGIKINYLLRRISPFRKSI